MRRHRLKQVTFFDGIALGAFLATFAFLLAFCFIDLLPPKSDAWVGFLGNMVVAAFSLGAAYLALGGNRLQILQTNDIEDERRENALIAARAVLPALLSEMSAVARNNLLLRFQPGHGAIGSAVVHPTAFMRLPESIIPDFKQCIEYADRGSQERLANILRHFQVQQVRENDAGIGVIAPNHGPLTLDEHTAISDALGWAVLHGLVSDAFGYARGSDERIPLSANPSNVRSAFVVAGLSVDNYPLLMQILEDRILTNRLERRWDTP